MTKYFILFATLTFTTLIAQTPSPAEKSMPCPECKSTGEADCPIQKCDKGLQVCPKPCLKLSEGTWIKMDIKGKAPTDVWRKFEYGNGGWQAFNQEHCGELIETYPDKKPKNLGKCPTCKGTTWVKCETCKNKGTVTCWACNGSKTFVLTPQNTSFVDDSGKIDPSFQLSIQSFAPRKFPYVGEFIAKLYSTFENKSFDVEKKQIFKFAGFDYAVVDVFNLPGKRQEAIVQRQDSKKTFTIPFKHEDSKPSELKQ
jgi:hypothetical protein